MSASKRSPAMAAVASDKVGEVRTLSASQQVYEATSQINAAKAELDKLQALYKPGDAAWHQCETIDDRLHDALTLLGQ